MLATAIRKRWLLAWVIVVAFLGHDALMVDAAHAATPAASPHARVRQATHTAAPLGVDDEMPRPLDADGCAAVRVALPPPPSADVEATGPGAASFAELVVDGPAVAPLGAAPPPPGSPPQVRRALLQVYRI